MLHAVLLPGGIVSINFVDRGLRTTRQSYPNPFHGFYAANVYDRLPNYPPWLLNKLKKIAVYKKLDISQKIRTGQLSDRFSAHI
jgi:hypothetical protein